MIKEDASPATPAAGGDNDAEDVLRQTEQQELKVEDEEKEEEEMLDIENASFCTRFKYVLRHFAPLGLIAFGGPTAHIALLRERFVQKLKLLDEDLFMELFGLCQAMPGPTSTQLVVALATLEAGIPGGMLAFLMWSIPAFIIMAVAGVTSGLYFDSSGGTPDWMAGLAPSATAQVFIASWQLSQSVSNSRVKIAIALFASCVTVMVMGDARVPPTMGSISFPLVLVVGGFVALADSTRGPERLKLYFVPPASATNAAAQAKRDRKKLNISRPVGVVLIVVWLVVLITLIVLRGTGALDGNDLAILFEGMVRIGSIIYGGGQVVLPMLQQEQYATTDQFFQGFALISAMPGPLFNFSAFLGGVYAGVAGAFVGLVGINLPALLLTFGVLPFWARLRRVQVFSVFIKGVGAASIGLLFTACIQLFEAGVQNAGGAVVFMVSGTMTLFFNVPVPVSILFGALLGFAFTPSAIGIGQDPYCP